MSELGDSENIPTKIIKLCASLWSNKLCVLFNSLIDAGSYPKYMKQLRWFQFIKKGVRNSLRNYRPISILCNLNKIFESLIASRVKTFSYEKELLSSNQYGFRKNKNTELAGNTLVNRLLPALELKSYAICVFLDLTACLDTLDQKVFFSKLYRYGISGVALNLLSHTI